jgi:hypothetical protein
MKEITIEGWEKHWEIVNSQIPNGVNPHAYRLGFLKAASLKQIECDELKAMLKRCLGTIEMECDDLEFINEIKKLL